MTAALVISGIYFSLRWYFQQQEERVNEYHRSLGLSEEEVQEKRRRREQELKYHFRDIDPD